jgi:hypothetical protein
VPGYPIFSGGRGWKSKTSSFGIKNYLSQIPCHTAISKPTSVNFRVPNRVPKSSNEGKTTAKKRKQKKIRYVEKT